MRAARNSWILALLACCAPAVAKPSAEAIIAAVKHNFDAVNDYSADMALTVKGAQVSINNMQATLYFKKPGKVHVEPKQGVALLPPCNLIGNPISELARSTKPAYLGSEKKQGIDCHVLRLDPAGNPQGRGSIKVWVDKQRSVLVATQASGAPALRTEWRTEKIDGRYYLPVEIRADLDQPGSGRLTATVKFSNYRINKGISDKVFIEKPGGPKTGRPRFHRHFRHRSDPDE